MTAASEHMVEGLRGLAEQVYAVSAEPSTACDRAGWVQLVAELQGLLNTLTGAQDQAIVRAVAIDQDWDQDGVIVETHRALGHISLDGPDLVAARLRIPHALVQSRVETAVRVAAGRQPRYAEDSLSPTAAPDAGPGQPTGLGAVAAAMREGHVDGYRAKVLAEELADAPAEAAALVIARLGNRLERCTGSQLRGHTRKLLAQIDQSALRQRIERARADIRLQRRVSDPGVDSWSALLPAEAALPAWAAVDQLALEYVQAGKYPTMAVARAHAMMDLITGNATVDVQVHLTVPADALPTDGEMPVPPPADPGPGGPGPDRSGPESPGAGPDPAPRRVVDGVAKAAVAGSPAVATAGLVEVTPIGRTETVFLDREWLRSSALVTRHIQQCDPGTGALRFKVDNLVEGDTTARYRPGERLIAHVKARDGRCRFPGCTINARFCDVDHVRAWPDGATEPDNLMCLCRRHHRIKQSPGWRVRLDTGAVARWRDPTGVEHTTYPVDRLTAARVAFDKPCPPTAFTQPTPRCQPMTMLEYSLEHQLAHHKAMQEDLARHARALSLDVRPKDTVLERSDPRTPSAIRALSGLRVLRVTLAELDDLDEGGCLRDEPPF